MSVIVKAENGQVDKKSSDYLTQLLSDKKQLQFYPNAFIHVEKLVDEGLHLLFYLKTTPTLLNIDVVCGANTKIRNMTFS